jgi:MFS family permease
MQTYLTDNLHMCLLLPCPHAVPCCAMLCRPQGLFGCLPWGVMQTYLTDYLHQQRGLSIQLATTVILLFGVGSAVGVIAGGAAGQALYNWWVPELLQRQSTHSCS